MSHGEDSAIDLRMPIVDDANEMWRIVNRTPTLDRNSGYYYLIFCRDFSETSIIATRGPEVVGFITGYVRPEAPDVLFAWQTAVDPDVTTPGLAGHMLHTLVDRVVPTGVNYLETTINPGNRAVRMLLRRFADERRVSVASRTLFGEGLFPSGHEAEILYRIGPLD